MDYREELREIYSKSTSSGRSAGSQQGHATGTGAGGTQIYPNSGFGMTPSSTSRSWSQFSSGSGSQSEGWSDSESESRSDVPVLMPVFGEELSHVEFRSLDEQKFRAMAALFEQNERQSVARLVGMKAPVSLFTPEVKKSPGGERAAKAFLKKCYEKLPFALPTAQAQKQIADQAETFVATLLLKEMADEPAGAKRRIK
jgi:hypothetical protein